MSGSPITAKNTLEASLVGTESAGKRYDPIIIYRGVGVSGGIGGQGAGIAHRFSIYHLMSLDNPGEMATLVPVSTEMN